MAYKTSNIDIVYLWVNSEDLNWQKRRKGSFNNFSDAKKIDLALYANTDGRFRDNNELLFNLRLLEKFFPDHGHIFVISDKQIPTWLDLNQNITIIDHSEIILNKENDIFSSSHIESYIHHIPNLSERFIYLNDDVFFGSPVEGSWWFEKKLKYFYDKTHLPYEYMQPRQLSPVNASVLSSNWLKTKYKNYTHVNRSMAHAPRPYLKSLLFDIETEAPELFSKVRSTTFRSWKTPPIMVDFIPRWLEQNKYAEIIKSKPLYIESGSKNLEFKLDILENKIGKVPFFCINDTCDNSYPNDKRLELIKNKLKKLIPNKSKYEKN